MFAANGIMFNHESPRRGGTFVTKKITDYVRTLATQNKPLQLGNLDAKRDWGHAKDYVRAMWLMLQQDEPLDLVIATGKSITVREFCEEAFKRKGIDLVWEADNRGFNKKSGRIYVEQNAKYFRPTEVDFLCGDASRAHLYLGWKPEITFGEMVDEMLS